MRAACTAPLCWAAARPYLDCSCEGLPPTHPPHTYIGSNIFNLASKFIQSIAVVLVSSLLNAAYFLPIVYRGFFAAAPQGEETGIKEAPLFCLVPLCLTAFGSLMLFFFHDSLLRLAQMALGIAS